MDEKSGLIKSLHIVLKKIEFFRTLLDINQPTQDDIMTMDILSQINRLENRKRIIHNLINK